MDSIGKLVLTYLILSEWSHTNKGSVNRKDHNQTKSVYSYEWLGLNLYYLIMNMKKINYNHLFVANAKIEALGVKLHFY